MTDPVPAIAIRDVPERHRYELTVDGAVAGISIYRLGDGVMVFEHTEVDEAYEGRGLGSRLA
jgi:predicted GNAT family acetyltransferase